ncbi:MAG: hypothetical protein H7A40_04195 [Chlamydiales bacterium]|nr:hypothetical protein [Chlamydiales bacterium]
MYPMMKLAIFSLMAVAAPEVEDSFEESTDEVSTEQVDQVLSRLEKLSEQIEAQVSALEKSEEDSELE